MAKGWSPRSSSARGAALVELALALPLLVVVIVGTADFARVFYMAMELQNAARAGAQYGAQSTSAAGDISGMKSKAVAAAFNINPVSPFATRGCWCATNTDPGSLLDCTPPTAPPSCGGGEHLVISVTVTAASTFSIIAGYPLPGIPRSFSVRRSATLRAQ